MGEGRLVCVHCGQAFLIEVTGWIDDFEDCPGAPNG